MEPEQQTPNPFQSPQVVDPPAAPRGPSDYKKLPVLRRNEFCSGIILAHVAVMFLGGFVPYGRFLGIFTTIGVIAVCVSVLTGPVYYNQLLPSGVLKTWGKANKVAAVILLLLLVGGYGAIMYFLLVTR